MEKWKQMLSKVPEVTAYFWIIKVLCTTVGETFADFINGQLGLGLTNTSYIMGTLLLIVLFFQFKARKYIPSLYWLAVVLLSVVGTLITDNLTDNLGISLAVTTVIFGVALLVTFIIWYLTEKTLSIHSIKTTRRETFYWLAILFTFALGTASGDLIAEQFSIGYWPSALIFAGVIAVIAIAYRIGKRFLLSSPHYQAVIAIFAFWAAYILTRPLGASIGDYLSQAPQDGGLGLGTVVTSGIFLITILGLVIYLSLTKKDMLADE